MKVSDFDLGGFVCKWARMLHACVVVLCTFGFGMKDGARKRIKLDLGRAWVFEDRKITNGCCFNVCIIQLRRRRGGYASEWAASYHTEPPLATNSLFPSPAFQLCFLHLEIYPPPKKSSFVTKTFITYL